MGCVLQGRLNLRHNSLVTVQVPAQGMERLVRTPASELAGYCQLSLRNKGLGVHRGESRGTELMSQALRELRHRLRTDAQAFAF